MTMLFDKNGNRRCGQLLEMHVQCSEYWHHWNSESAQRQSMPEPLKKNDMMSMADMGWFHRIVDCFYLLFFQRLGKY